MTYRIVYSSTASHRLSEDELSTLLADAIDTNHKLGVTGLLYYSRKSFLQLFDSPDADTAYALLTKIRASHLHKNIRVLSFGEVSEPMFPIWFMGFQVPRLPKAWKRRKPLNNRTYVPNAEVAVELLKAQKILGKTK